MCGVLAATDAEPEHLEMHLRKAGTMGITGQELLETLEMIVIPAGVDKFERAVRLLNDIVHFCPPEALEGTDRRPGGATSS